MDVGFVGRASRIDIAKISAVIKEEIVPVISPIGADEQGTVLNINADVAAAALASAIQAAKMIYVTDVPGIMRDPRIQRIAHSEVDWEKSERSSRTRRSWWNDSQVELL